MLEQSDLLPLSTSRISAIYLLFDTYKSEPLSNNPFAGVFVAILEVYISIIYSHHNDNAYIIHTILYHNNNNSNNNNNTTTTTNNIYIYIYIYIYILALQKKLPSPLVFRF